eukprot:TRINITY_DN9440_c0_g1_i1.p1 TRINITY_DN9440_c0_g1~~TRINITY_DN9440_c0_g1_i1.p1  ORF type:complete len:135 (+),score=34.02 TRINITY_DN9440_c0_g1_i1:85-489(+)
MTTIHKPITAEECGTAQTEYKENGLTLYTKAVVSRTSPQGPLSLEITLLEKGGNGIPSELTLNEAFVVALGRVAPVPFTSEESDPSGKSITRKSIRGPVAPGLQSVNVVSRISLSRKGPLILLTAGEVTIQTAK